MTRLALASLLTLLLAGCGTATGSPARPAGALQQWSGPHSGVDAPSTRVVRSANDWSTLWRQLGRAAPPAPTWNTHMAVAVFLGQRRTAGYRIEVFDAREAPDRLVINFRERRPEAGRIVAQVLTSPWAVVVVPASALPVVAQSLPGSAPEK